METILVLDFGTHYSQDLARKVRSFQVYSEILPWNTDVKEIADKKPLGIILSGVSTPDALDRMELKPELYELNIPILGLGLGMELMAVQLGDSVTTTADLQSELFWDCSELNEDESFAALEDRERKLYGVQLEPAAVETDLGARIIENFVLRICGCTQTWTMDRFVDSMIESIRTQVGDKKVVCGLSGGIDSSAAAVLVHKAIGSQLTCIFVDNGLMRKNEVQQVVDLFSREFDLNLVAADAGERFLAKLKGVADPETKRKIIGTEFIRVFEEEAKKLGSVDFLVQGTLYPDVIESGIGEGAVIKSHHNVGGLPDDLNFELIEPLRQLFKDEVRMVARQLGLPDSIVMRHPFPGPGLAVRVIGEITEAKLEILREADAIFIEELRNSGWYGRVWQALAVLTDTRTVGMVQEDRTYDHVVALRAVNSVDGMAADWVRLPYDLLERVSSRILREVKGVNRVVYDISSKPPATIEWE